MAVDIRCVVSCSLGTVISGNVNDDYVQGTGLIKCTGSVVINGVITPAIGTAVTISYTKGGTTRQIPRKLRVLSSFADPFRGTTAVELGCKLTYLQDLQEKIDWTAFDDNETTMTQQDAQSVTVPIRAQAVATKCLTELGITANGLALTNNFSIERFDFSAGYVQVLSDLLVSECKCGYLDTNEVLQVFSLNAAGGTGPALDATQLVDIGKIGVGQLPGEAVTVSYSTLKLKPEVQTGSSSNAGTWDSETTSSKYSTSISYSNKNTNQQAIQTYNILDQTTRETTYQTITSSTGEQLRLTSQVVTTYTSQAPAHIGNAYSAYLAAGLAPPSIEISKTTTETYTYDSEGNETRMIRSVVGGAAFLVGSISIDFAYPDGSVVNVGTGGSFVLETEIRDTSTVGNYQQVSTTLFGAWHKSQAGQLAIAEGRTSFTTAAQAAAYINELTASSGNYIIDQRTETVARQQPSVAASQADINNAINAKGGNASNGSRVESESELALAVGSATAQRRISLSIPYSPDDIFFKSGANYYTSASDAEQKAKQYGRIQNRLLLGNRNGMSIQIAPELMPAAPFAPFTITAKGATAQYRTNGTSWTFDSAGMVVSTDALFWGGVGGTFATRWFPVAPGITSLPTTPAVVDGQMTVSAVVPVVNETVVTEARLRVGCDVQSLAYPLELLTVVPAMRVRTLVEAAKIRKVQPPAAAVTVAAVAPVVAIGASVAPPVATVAIGRLVPVVVSGAGVSVPAAAVAVDWLEPDQVGKPRTQVKVPAGNVAIAGLVPAVASGGSIAVPAVGMTVAAAAPVRAGSDADPNFSSVSLLLLMNGSNNSTAFTDSSSNAFAVTAVADAKISTTQSKFGGSSGYFDGTLDRLTVASNAKFDFGTGDFTVELWAYHSSFVKDRFYISAAGTGGLFFGIGDTTANNIGYGRAGVAWDASVAHGMSINTWNHIALCRSGSSIRIFINGSQVGSTATNTNAYNLSTTALNVASQGADFYMNAYIDSLRVTKGVARYTANFTAPVVDFPNY